MSKTARMILYPLLALMVGFFVYTMFFMDKGAEQTPINTQPATEQVENIQVEAVEK